MHTVWIPWTKRNCVSARAEHYGMKSVVLDLIDEQFKTCELFISRFTLVQGNETVESEILAGLSTLKCLYLFK